MILLFLIYHYYYHLVIHLEFNYSFKWVDDGAYGFKNKETGEWNGLMGELLAQVKATVGKSEDANCNVTRIMLEYEEI